jgi:hypothetical protein
MKKIKVEEETYKYSEKVLLIIWCFFCGMFFLDFTGFIIKVFATILVLYGVFVMFWLEIVPKNN